MQLIISSYPLPFSILSPGGIDCNIATTLRIRVKEESYIEFIQENLIEFQV